jgi:FAD:protein FMN transferase
MGTSVRVEVYGGTASDRQAAADEAFGAIGEVDRLMSDYRADSELTHVNQTAAQQPVSVSAPMFAVLDAAERVSLASGGAFDITVGPLVSLWGFKDKRAHVPTSAELADVRDLVGFRNVALDRDAHRVRFVRPGVQIDLGGIAKGFALDVAAESLRRRGLSGLVDAGGNQFMVGLPAGKQKWSVGISSPDMPGGLLGVVDIAGGALSTSSDASNFLIANGRTYGHLLDPRSLQPSAASLSVTIVSPDGTLSDALSKAVFVLGPHDGLALLASFPNASGIVAYREEGGRIGVAVSPGIARAFHRAGT